MKTDFLWYSVYYKQKGRSLIKRFLTLKEAEECKKKKRGFIEEWNRLEYVNWLESHPNDSDEGSYDFYSDKILGVGKNVPRETLIDILSQKEPIEREVRVLKYKLDRPKQFPEVQKLLDISN